MRVHGETWALRASSGGLSFSIKISLKRCRASRQVAQTLPGITVTAARLWQFSILPRSQSTPALNDSAAARLGLEKSNHGLMDSLTRVFGDFVIIRVSSDIINVFLTVYYSFFFFFLAFLAL